MLDLAGRVLAATWRRIDSRAADIKHYGFGGRAWVGR